MDFVIMTTGKTHSGKTTFGGELAKKIKKSCVLDFDILAAFLKKTYPRLQEGDYYIDPNYTAKGRSIKLKIRLEIFQQALKTNLAILLTTANASKKLRTKTRLSTHKAGRKLIMIYFNRPEEVLLERIAASNRSKDCLTTSKDFVDLLLNKQRKVYEIPSAKEADYFFEITDERSWKEVQRKVLNLVKG